MATSVLRPHDILRHFICKPGSRHSASEGNKRQQLKFEIWDLRLAQIAGHQYSLIYFLHVLLTSNGYWIPVGDDDVICVFDLLLLDSRN